MRVVIRADASSTVGIGHLTRCFALAQALHDLGAQTVLATTPTASTLMTGWVREGATVEMLDVHPGSADDADATRRLVEEHDASWLCVDGYGFGAEFHRRAVHRTRLAIVDDLGAEDLDADLVCNGNLYAAEAMYPGTRARLLVGPRYALLRREFRTTAAPNARSGVIVSLGGADPGARTEPLVMALAERGIHGSVVVGPTQRDASSVRATAETLGWDVVEAPEHLAAHLAGCELAVIGAGTTTLEALALGTPMVAVRIAENQRRGADTLERLGLAVTVDGASPIAAAEAVVNLMRDPRRRAALSQRARGTIDGMGALRVAEAMREPSIRLRPATLADADLLLAWRNDPVTREASFNTGVVTPAEHLDWIRRALASPDRAMLIGELGGHDIGVVRLDRRSDRAEIGITLAPEARGRRLAATLLRLATRDARDAGIRHVDARIRRGNTASLRAFAAAGFSEQPGAGGPPDVVLMTISLPAAG